MQQLNIVPGALPDWLISVENLKNVTRDPLTEARRVLLVDRAERQITVKSLCWQKRWEPKWATVGHE